MNDTPNLPTKIIHAKIRRLETSWKVNDHNDDNNKSNSTSSTNANARLDNSGIPHGHENSTPWQ